MDFESALNAAMAETLETLAFMAVKPVRLVWGTVPVLRPVVGAVTLVFTDSTLTEIAAELAGQPGEPVPPAALLDLAGELANTLAGRLLVELLPGDTKFELGLPHKHSGNFHCPADGWMRYYEISGHMFLVLVEGATLLGCGQPGPGPEPANQVGVKKGGRQ